MLHDFEEEYLHLLTYACPPPLCVGAGNLPLQSPACRRGGVCPGAASDSDDECWSLELMRFRSDFELWVDAVMG